ncbi:minor capsid protein [Paraliobacillus ryukyuensis]|uniref:minor capsid protein n=1 Tax=Paraliobacillus ryukyuensis TaxID=200904 RepID=UPI0009A869FB|nr:minor capsid protein [Paraliobacillus ryukyuensis]
MVNSYWRDRELEHIEKTIQNDNQTIDRISNLYDNALDEIQDQIDSFYGRYADISNISMQEARQRVTKADVEKYKRKAKRYVANRTFTKRANDEMRLYNVTMQINRLELLKAHIRLELIALTSDEERIMYEHLSQGAREEYERQASIMGQALTYPTKTIESIVNASFMSATWSERLWDNQDALRTELDRLLSRGIVQGLNPRVLARDLRKSMDAGKYNSERLLTTELARVQGDVFKDSMEQADFHAYEFIAEPTACKVCSAIDGKIFNLSEIQVGKNMYPIHPNCRCSTAAAHDRRAFEKGLEERGL